MIEFALILPLMVLVVVGIFELGRAFKELNTGGFGGPGDIVDVGTFTVVLVH